MLPNSTVETLSGNTRVSWAGLALDNWAGLALDKGYLTDLVAR